MSRRWLAIERVPESPFLEARASYEEAGPVLLGLPLDATVSFRPGTRFGPARIRAVSEGLESYSPVLDRDLTDVALHDGGSLLLPYAQVETALDRIEEAVSVLVEEGRWPFLLGGEHLVTLGVLRALAQHYPDLVVIQLDAHADQRDVYLGERLSHATVMRRAGELLGPGADLPGGGSAQATGRRWPGPGPTAGSSPRTPARPWPPWRPCPGSWATGPST